VFLEVAVQKLVEVTWVDPTTDAGWQENDHKAPLTEMKSYGLLISNTKKQLCIAGTYDKDEKKYADRSRFPKGCVVKIREIEVV
jgi:hypothetical protein